MRHHRSETPAYFVWVLRAPSSNGKSKQAYFKAVAAAATEVIRPPIASDDIEVEVIYATTRPQAQRGDADNIVKPTLDALKGIAYTDDRQVRTATGTVFDKAKSNNVDGRVEYMSRLFQSPDPDVVLILIYSDQRLRELGGEAEVQRSRYEQWQREFQDSLEKARARGA
jgi:Holliday junction resolvase RusA-like endonuclease